MPRFTRAVPVSGIEFGDSERTGAPVSAQTCVDGGHCKPPGAGVVIYIVCGHPGRRSATRRPHQRMKSAAAVAVDQGVFYVEELGRLAPCRTGAAPGPAGGGGRRGSGRRGRCRTCGRGRPGARRPPPRRPARSRPRSRPARCGIPARSRVARSARVRSLSARSRSAGSACRARRTASASSRLVAGSSMAGGGEIARPRSAPDQGQVERGAGRPRPGCAAGRAGWPARRPRTPTAPATSTASTTIVQIIDALTSCCYRDVRVEPSPGVERGRDVATRGATGEAHGGAAEDDRLVDADDVPGDGVPVVVGHRVERGDRELGPAGRVVEQPRRHPGQVVGVAGGEQLARPAVPQHLAERRDVAGDDRHAGRHRLGGDDAEGLAAGVRRAEDVDRVQHADLVLLRHLAEEDGAVAQVLGEPVPLLVGVAGAGDKQPQPRPAGREQLERLEQDRQALARLVHPAEEADRAAGPRPAVERLARAGSGGWRRRSVSARRRRPGARRTSSAPPRRPRSGRRSSPARCAAPAGWRAAPGTRGIAVCTVATIGPDATQQASSGSDGTVGSCTCSTSKSPSRSQRRTRLADSGPNASRATDPLYGTGMAFPAGTT